MGFNNLADLHKKAQRHTGKQFMTVRYTMAVTSSVGPGGRPQDSNRFARITNNGATGNKAIIGASLDQAINFLGALVACE